MPLESIRLSLLLRIFNTELHKEHKFPRIAGAYHERAQQTLIEAKVIKFQSMFKRIPTDIIAYGIVYIIHQMTFLYVKNLVKGTCDMKSHSIHHVISDISPYLFLCEPSFIRESKFQFVAITIDMLAANNRLYLWEFYLTNSDKIVLHLLLLSLELFFILETLPLTSATYSIVLACRFCPERRIFVEANSHSLHVRAFLLLHLKVYHIARHDVWHKDHFIIHSCYRLAFCRTCRNCYFFQYRKLLLVSSHIINVNLI